MKQSSLNVKRKVKEERVQERKTTHLFMCSIGDTPRNMTSAGRFSKLHLDIQLYALNLPMSNSSFIIVLVDMDTLNVEFCWG